MKIDKRRIYWLHSHFLNWMGGHKYIYEVSKRLARKYDLYIVSDCFSTDAIEKFHDSSVKTLQLGTASTNNIFYWLFLPFFIVRNFYRLKKYLRQQDIIITSMFPMNVIAMLLKNQSIQLCYEPFAFFYDKNFINGFTFFQKIFIYLAKFSYSPIDKLATSKAKIVLTLSDFNRDWIKRVYHVNSEVVYEGVDTNFFKKRHDKQLEKKYKAYKIVFHSTDFTRIKGTEYLFKAMHNIGKNVPNIKLLITNTIQNDLAKRELLEFAREKGFDESVEFLGFLPYKMLPSYLSLANVVVQPSVGQSMNLTVKEAMSCGTPVITSIEGKEQFSNGTAGFHVNPKNVSELSSKVLMIIKDNKFSKKMSLNGRKIIEQKFSWSAVCDKIDDQISLLI